MFSPFHESTPPSSHLLANLMQKVYWWMVAGLTVTGLVAHSLYTNQEVLKYIFSFKWGLLLLIIAQLALVSAISFMIQRISYLTAVGLYFLYAASVGITLAPIFLIYTASSIGMVFGITAVTFAVMATYGYFTQADLTGIGNILFMGLIGIIIASLANMFFQSSAMDLIISYVGVLIFTGLIAYDTQKIKVLMYHAAGEPALARKLSIVCALSLYLDFINLFLLLLRLLGGRNSD